MHVIQSTHHHTTIYSACNPECTSPYNYIQCMQSRVHITIQLYTVHAIQSAHHHTTIYSACNPECTSPYNYIQYMQSRVHITIQLYTVHAIQSAHHHTTIYSACNPECTSSYNYIQCMQSRVHITIHTTAHPHTNQYTRVPQTLTASMYNDRQPTSGESWEQTCSGNNYHYLILSILILSLLLLHIIAVIITPRKCYSIGCTQAVLYCTTLLSRLRLWVDVIALSLNESVTFACCAWAPWDQIDVCLNIYVYIYRRGYAVHLTGVSLRS